MGSSVLLTPGLLPPDLGWRLAFGIGAAIGLVVLFFRRTLPESPRWLLLHGRSAEADRIVATIEQKARVHPQATGIPVRLQLFVRERGTNLVDLGMSLFRHYPRRAVLGLVLMASQAFCYNAIFFTYALVLDRFFQVPSQRVGLYLLPFSVTNFLGPLALGWLFDRWGRRQMITGTYAVTGILLAATAVLFERGSLTAESMTIAFSCVFFFASAAASSAYLTVSESFPVEVRALAIAVFYAFGTALGGIAAPWVFGTLIGTGDPAAIGDGYMFGAGLMVVAALTESWLGIAAERRSLEEVARPLSSA